MAPTKYKTRPTAAAVPISGTPMRPNSRPSAPAALRVPSMVIHDSDTLALDAVMRTKLRRRSGYGHEGAGGDGQEGDDHVGGKHGNSDLLRFHAPGIKTPTTNWM